MVGHPHTPVVIDEPGDAIEGETGLTIGWGLLMIISCCPLVTAISCIHQEAQ